MNVTMIPNNKCMYIICKYINVTRFVEGQGSSTLEV